MEARKIQPMTYADFEKLPEDARVELIDGVFCDLAAPTMPHITLAYEISRRLGNHLLGTRCRVYPEPALRFEESMSAQNAVRPDIAVLCEPEKYRKTGIVGAPTLIVEMLSPSTVSRDQTKKLRLYESFGVKEYWIVYQDQRAILQCVLIDGEFDIKLIDKGAIVSTSIEGFSIELEELYTSIPLDESMPFEA